MTLFKLVRDYIAALRAQTAATVEATAAANRAINDAAWSRYREHRAGHHHHHGHHLDRCEGNASMPGGCA